MTTPDGCDSDGCGRDDDSLEETPAGTLLCPTCKSTAALDAGL